VKMHWTDFVFICTLSCFSSTAP